MSTLIEAEDYARYFDLDAGNNGGEYRMDDVDIGISTNDAYFVGWFAGGEWLEYDVTLAQEGYYAVDIVLATPRENNAYSIAVDGNNKTHAVPAPLTGNWHTWQTQEVELGYLSAGPHIIRLQLLETDNAGLNVDSLTIKSSAATQNSSSSSSGILFPEGDVATGQTIYLQQCQACHGNDGTGNDALNAPPMVSCAVCDNFNALADYIDGAMPTGNAGACTGQCASDVSAYIIDAFNQPFDTATCNAQSTTSSPTHVKRLSRREYILTVTDLLQSDSIDFSNLPHDASEENFNTLAENQVVSKLQLQNYIDIAISETERLFNEPMRRDNVVGCDVQNTECLNAFIQNFGRLAYRRPLSDDETLRLNNFALNNASSTESQIALALQTLLSSPEFLYRLEIGLHASNWERCAGEDQLCEFSGTKRVRYGRDDKWAEGIFDSSVMCNNATFGDAFYGQYKTCQVSNIYGELSLDPYEIASRLAFTLWGRGPDSSLLDAARDGALDTASGRRNIIQDLLADERAKTHLSEFFSQWLALNALNELEQPVDTPPRWYDNILADMTNETQTLLREYTWEGKNFMGIFTANHSYMTPELSRYYGVNAPDQNGINTLSEGDPRHHTGILTHASNMIAKTDGDPVAIRGNWLRRTFLCKDIKIPPNVTTLIAGQFAGLSPIEIIAARNTEADCKGCHAIIDPIGIVFAPFNGDGIFDYSINPHNYPIAPGFPDLGTHNTSLQDIATALATMPEVGQCIADRLFLFSRFKAPEEEDQCTVHQASNTFANSGYDFVSLIVALTEDPSFVVRHTPETH